MTTRRSRLKAVANLPIRRKITSIQGNIEESTQNFTEIKDNCSTEKTEPTNKNVDFRKDDCYNSVENICKENQRNEDLKERSCMPNINYDLSQRTSIENSTDTAEANIRSQENNINSSDYIKNLENFKSIENNSNNISNNDKSIKQPLVSPAEQKLGKISNNSIFNQSSEQKNVDSNMVDIGNSGCFTIISPENLGSTTLSSINLIECSNDGSVTNMTVLNSNDFNGNFNVQVYRNVVEHSNLCTDLLKNKSDGNNEIILSLEESEPILTNLINCNSEKRINNVEVSNFEGSNLLPLRNSTSGIFVETASQSSNVLEVIDYTGNENTSSSVVDSDKLGDNSVFNEFDDGTSNCNLSNLNIKRSVKSIKRKRSKCNDFTKKLADARKEFYKKFENSKPDRSTLKMIDLIFYNPTTNPMESKNKSEKKGASNEDSIQEILAEEQIDEPQEFDLGSNIQSNPCDNKMPVPQVKIGVNGEIILDEKSVIIETTDVKKGREDFIKNSIPVFEDRITKFSYYRGKTRKTRDWTDSETKRFYKALNTIGPDFSLMQKYFPKRSRLELKNKFKREERLNRNLIDKALINPSEFDMTQLENDLAIEKRAEEVELEMKLSKGTKVKLATKRPRLKSSFFSRELIEYDRESENSKVKSKNHNIQGSFPNEKDKKKQELGFIFQKFVLNELEEKINEQPQTSKGLYLTSGHGLA